MGGIKPIQSALISVYNKQGLDQLVHALNELNITIYSTGGTLTYIEALGIPVIPVDSLTNFPEILGGRVKTLHPGVFGGILYQRGLTRDEDSIETHGIKAIDLVVVDERSKFKFFRSSWRSWTPSSSGVNPSSTLRIQWVFVTFLHNFP